MARKEIKEVTKKSLRIEKEIATPEELYPNWNKDWGIKPKKIEDDLKLVIDGCPQQWYILCRELTVNRKSTTEAIKIAGITTSNPARKVAQLKKKTLFLNMFNKMNKDNGLERSFIEAKAIYNFSNWTMEEFAANYGRIAMKVESGEIDIEQAKTVASLQKSAEELRGMRNDKGKGTNNVNKGVIINNMNVSEMSEKEVKEALKELTQNTEFEDENYLKEYKDTEFEEGEVLK